MLNSQPPTTRTRTQKIADPAARFSGWHYPIEAHHYETLGVTLREFTRTEPLMRDGAPALDDQGKPIKMRQNYLAWCVTTPPSYSFEQGYLFHGPNGSYIQIAAWWIDENLVEVHYAAAGQHRTGVLVTEGQLAHWLMTGEQPAPPRLVDTASSKAGERLAWELNHAG